MKGFSAFFFALLASGIIFASAPDVNYHGYIRRVLHQFSPSQWLEINNRLATDNLLVRDKTAAEQIYEDLKWLEINGYQNNDIANFFDTIFFFINVIPQDDLSNTGYEHSIDIYIDSKLFRIIINFIPGIDYSPFDVEYHTSVSRYSIENISTNKKIHFPGTFHNMLENYAFYGGSGSRYRVSPEELITLFGIKGKEPNQFSRL